jgi:SGNH hydrolase-like domain, acetyltransferase AlgX
MKKGNNIKKIVFCFFIAMLFIPMLQSIFHFSKEKELGGYFNTESYIPFSDSLFREGVYQEKMENAIKDNAGFHNFFVRIQCQLNYSLFGIAKVQAVVVGKEGYLFQQNYIDAVTGEGFNGEESIPLQMQKAKVVQDILKKKNIDLVFALAPGKGSYYEEFIPDVLLKNRDKNKTNYAFYKKEGIKEGINMIDLRSYFLSLKDTIHYPLFSKIGVHWGDYASVIAMDTISHYIAALHKIKMKEFYITAFEKRDTLKRTDRDAALLLNTFSDPPHYSLPYVKIKYKTDTANTKPNLLVVGDSYFSCLVATGIVDSVYANWNYWLYSNRISSIKNKPFDLKTELEQRDIILLMATDGSMSRFPFDFIDEAYNLYAPRDAAYYALKNKEMKISISQTLQNIYAHKKWKKELIESAKEKGISKEQFFLDNALWIYNERQLKMK